jgi:hypothetical protein
MLMKPSAVASFHDQELLRHKEFRTPMVLTHMLSRGGRGVHSPLDRLRKELSVERRRMMRAGPKRRVVGRPAP